MGRLTSKVGIVALGRGANALAVYVVYALAARTWDKVQCEVFAAVWVLSNALVPIFLIGLPTAVLYFFPRRENTRGLALQAAALQQLLCRPQLFRREASTEKASAAPQAAALQQLLGSKLDLERRQRCDLTGDQRSANEGFF